MLLSSYWEGLRGIHFAVPALGLLIKDPSRAIHGSLSDSVRVKEIWHGFKQQHEAHTGSVRRLNQGTKQLRHFVGILLRHRNVTSYLPV